MDGLKEEYTMTTPKRNRMRRHTRPADFVSKARQAEALTFSRPGGCAFSFNGEFPDMADQQPVEAKSRRRSYTAGHNTGSYEAIRRDEARRMPPVNKHGVHVLPALVMLMALMVGLGSVLLVQMGQRNAVQSAINYKQDRINVLTVACASTERDIASQSNDVNIRQEAVRMGLISSKGVNVMYLDAPEDAVITLADAAGIQSLASIWGQ